MKQVFLYLTKNLTYRFIVCLIFIVTGYLKFTHDYFLLIWNFDELITIYGKKVDLFFLVSTGIIFLWIVFYFFKLFKKWYFGIISFLKIAGRIKQLTASEQSVLREFHIQHNEIVYMPFNEPVVRILINDGFLRLVSDIMKYDHVPLEQTKNYLRYCNRELIGIPEDSHDLLIDRNSRFTLDLMRKRPKWTDNLYRLNFL